MADWIYVDDAKLKEGWYPVLICYDPTEGFFPDAAYYDNGFKQRAVAHVLNKRYPDFESASQAARDNDPNW